MTPEIAQRIVDMQTELGALTSQLKGLQELTGPVNVTIQENVVMRMDVSVVRAGVIWRRNEIRLQLRYFGVHTKAD